MWIVLLAGLPALLSSASVSGITLFGISGTHARTLLRKLSIRSVQNESLMLSTAYRSSRCGCAGVFRQLHLAVVDYIHIAALVLSCFWVQDRPSMSDLDILGIVHESLYFFAWGPCHKQKVSFHSPFQHVYTTLLRCEMPKLREHAACSSYLIISTVAAATATDSSCGCSFGTSVRSETNCCAHKSANAICTLA